MKKNLFQINHTGEWRRCFVCGRRHLIGGGYIKMLVRKLWLCSQHWS